MTTKDLTEAEAIDPHLLDLLENGKYHVIHKETQSGYIDEKVIYKN